MNNREGERENYVETVSLNLCENESRKDGNEVGMICYERKNREYG